MGWGELCFGSDELIPKSELLDLAVEIRVIAALSDPEVGVVAPEYNLIERTRKRVIESDEHTGASLVNLNNCVAANS